MSCYLYILYVCICYIYIYACVCACIQYNFYILLERKTFDFFFRHQNFTNSHSYCFFINQVNLFWIHNCDGNQVTMYFYFSLAPLNLWLSLLSSFLTYQYIPIPVKYGLKVTTSLFWDLRGCPALSQALRSIQTPIVPLHSFT